MTVDELCEVFSKEIGKSFDLSIKGIEKELLKGATLEMTEQEVFVQMIINSMIVSANLAAQTMIVGLVEMGIIPKDVLAAVKLRPDIHLVKQPENPNQFAAAQKGKPYKKSALNEPGREKGRVSGADKESTLESTLR